MACAAVQFARMVRCSACVVTIERLQRSSRSGYRTRRILHAVSESLLVVFVPTGWTQSTQALSELLRSICYPQLCFADPLQIFTLRISKPVL